MPQVSAHHRFAGLDVNSNPLATNPYKELGQGARSATVIADNGDLQGAGKIGNRRGFDYFTNPTSALITAMFEYQNNIVQHQNSNTQLWFGDATSGTRTQYTGTYAAPTGYRMDATVSRGSLFFTTSNGPYKLDAIVHTPARSGLTKGLDTRLTATGSNGFMNGFSKACYHVTWTRLDANGQTVRSDTSARIIVTNSNRVTISSATQAAGTATITTASAHGFSTSDTILISGVTPAAYNGSYVITSTGATTFTYAVAGGPGAGTVFGTAERQMNVSVAFTAPFDALTTDSYEVWRSVTKDAGTADPGDTCFLVVAAVFGGTPGATITYVDTTSDTTLQTATPLYTNASQDGPTQGNVRPPFCTSVANYKDYAIYANASIDHQYTIDLLATINLVAGTSKIIITPTTGSARNYTFNVAENVSTQTVQIFTGGSSPSLNITQTMQSLAHVINGDSSGLWYAEYLSYGNPNNLPGIVRIWARNPTSGSFVLTADGTTTGAQFNPVLPISGTTISSSNDARPNRLFFSKFQQPDHVPLLNTIDIGKLSEPIQRVIASRDALYIIKTDGIWFLSGFTLPTSPNELDTTCHVIAPASVASVNNQVYMLSNQGFVQLSTSGTQVISFDIEPLVSPLLAMTNVGAVSFGVAHESERKYICWVPSASSDTYATQAFVFHTFLQSWVRWTKPANAGLALNLNYNLYLSSGIETCLLRQRKNGDVTDYSDEGLPITVTAQSGTTVTATYANLNFPPTAGISLHQGAVFSKVTAVRFVSGTSWQFTIDRTATYTNAAAVARLPIYAHIRCAPDVCGDSGIVKTFFSAVITLQSATVTQASVEVGTNESPALTTSPIVRLVSGGWGTNPWGETGWGDAVNVNATVPFAVDVPVPDNSGEALTIGWIHNVSQEPFVLVQATIFYDANAEYEVTQ